MAPVRYTSNYKVHFVNTFLAGNEHNKQIISISLWALWYHRNKCMYEGVKFSLQETLSFIRGYHQEICLSHENIKSFSSSMTEKLWRPPNNGFIKINFDASFQRDS
ncbi:hypothetical protein V6Z11_A10G114000 [Gossypium hirsutum]